MNENLEHLLENSSSEYAEDSLDQDSILKNPYNLSEEYGYVLDANTSKNIRI